MMEGNQGTPAEGQVFENGFHIKRALNVQNETGAGSTPGGGVPNFGSRPSPGDRLLTPEETAALLQVTKVWLYRNAHRFTFTRKLSRKVLRFQESGVRRFIEKGRP